MAWCIDIITSYTARSIPAYGMIPTRLGVSPLYKPLVPSILTTLLRQSPIPLYCPDTPRASLVLTT